MNVVADVEATFKVSLTTVAVSVSFDKTAADTTVPFAKNSPITALAKPIPLYFLNDYFLCKFLFPILTPL